MARRRFRIFIVKRRLAEGCVFQNTKEAKAMFEDIKRDPIFGLRNAVPDIPVLLMNTYPSYRMAEALIMPDLFATNVCVGIARRLPNGRGYRVVACIENQRLLAGVVGIDPAKPGEDKTIIINMVDFHMVVDPFPEGLVTERKSDYGIKVDFHSTLDRGLFPSKEVLVNWIDLIKDVGVQKPKTVSDWIRANENSGIKHFEVVKQQLLSMSNNKPDEYALKDIRLGEPVETDDRVDVDVQFVIFPLKTQMLDIEIVNTRTGDDSPKES